MQRRGPAVFRNAYWIMLAHLCLSGQAVLAADFSGANLSGARLTNTDLRGSDLSGATLTGADLSGADLRDTNVTQQQLDSASGYATKLPASLQVKPCAAATASRANSMRAGLRAERKTENFVGFYERIESPPETGK